MSNLEDDSDSDFGRYLPVPVAARPPRPSLVRNSTEASFLSQLIATERNPPQKRNAPAGHAVSAYGASAASTVRRMPKGYNRTVVA